MDEIAVIGAGSWGTALAILLASKGYNLKLCVRREELKEKIQATRLNQDYLPGVQIPNNINLVSNLEEAVQDAKYILLVVPTQSLRTILEQMNKVMNSKAILINASKGLEKGTKLRPSQMINHCIDSKNIAGICALSGPNHAEEVALNIPSATVVSSESISIAKETQDLLMTNYFRVYTNPDLTGVELGGALKNIIAIGAGICDGLGYGDNTKAALLTRGINEIARMGVTMGADPLTFSGLAGIGDLFVTCSSKHSRNRRLGEDIGKGKTLKEALSSSKMVVEGVKTTWSAYELAQEYKVEMPITEQIYNILYLNKEPKSAVKELMQRVKTYEMEDLKI